MLHGPDYLYTQSNGAVPKGITLYSRTHNINKPPEMTLPAQVNFTLVPSGANGFRANFQVPGSTISLCSTTPTVAGQYADPCIDLAVDVVFSLSLQISDTPNQLLTVTGANISLSNFKFSQGNWSTDVALAINQIVSFLGGPNYAAMMVKTIDSTSVSVKQNIQAQAIKPLDDTLGGYEQTALAAINQQLQPAVTVTRLIHTAVWAQNQQNAQMLSLLFAPPSNGITIDPSRQTGQFSGTLTFDSSVTTLPASCATLNTSSQFAGQVQIGPRPIVAINAGTPVFGSAPLQGLSVAFTGGALQGRQCPYTLSHLAVGLPNILNFSNFAYKATGNASVSYSLMIQPSAWSSPVVLGPNGNVLFAGTAMPTQSNMARTIVATNAQRIAPTTSGSPSVGGGQTVAQTWSTSTGSTAQTAVNPKAMNLIASTGVSVHAGVGALPQQGRSVAVSPIDPAAAQSKTISWGTSVQPTTAMPQSAAAPAWTPATTTGVTGVGTTAASSLQRSTTLNHATTLQTQQQAAPVAAPSSLSH
jgi:hypothetical protein